MTNFQWEHMDFVSDQAREVTQTVLILHRGYEKNETQVIIKHFMLLNV